MFMKSFVTYRLLTSIIFPNIIFYRSYSYWLVGNPPSTPVIIVFVSGLSSLLINRSLPAFDAKKGIKIHFGLIPTVLLKFLEIVFSKIRMLSFVAKKRQRQNVTISWKMAGMLSKNVLLFSKQFVFQNVTKTDWMQRKDGRWQLWMVKGRGRGGEVKGYGKYNGKMWISIVFTTASLVVAWAFYKLLSSVTTSS